jgi:hypothetical protein
VLWKDWCRGGRGDRPAFLKPFIADEDARAVRRSRHQSLLPNRQTRHLA